jgi:hypothetical protein
MSSLTADRSQWHVERDGLSRSYNFSGVRGPKAAVSLKLNVRLERSVGEDLIRPILTMNLRPLRLQSAASFVMGLVTADRSKGGVVEVRAHPLVGEHDAALLVVDGSDNVKKCLSAILSGEDMTFAIGDRAQSPIRLPLQNDEEFRRLYMEAYADISRASPTIHRLSFRSVARSIDSVLSAAANRRRVLASALKERWRWLAISASKQFFSLKATTFEVSRRFSLRETINSTTELLKRRTRAHAMSEAPNATRDRRHLNAVLQNGISTFVNAVKAMCRSAATSFKSAKRRSTEIVLRKLTELTQSTRRLSERVSFLDNIGTLASRLRPQMVPRDWVVFGGCVAIGIAIIVILFNLSNTHPTPGIEISARGLDTSPQVVSVVGRNSGIPTASPMPPSEPASSLTSPAQAGATADKQTATVSNSDPIRKVLSQQEYTSSATGDRSARASGLKPYAIGDTVILKHDFVGCREPWQNDGWLGRGSTSGGACSVQLPTGTKMVIANVRANSDICVRFSDSVVCYWATDGVLKASKQTPDIPARQHQVDARMAKARVAIGQGDDEHLKFLFDR